MWWFHHLLSGSIAKGRMPRVSRQSHLSANDKANNEMIPGTVHISPGWGKPWKTSARRPSDEVFATNHRLK